jgi:hypothetical protein
MDVPNKGQILRLIFPLEFLNLDLLLVPGNIDACPWDVGRFYDWGFPLLLPSRVEELCSDVHREAVFVIWLRHFKASTKNISMRSPSAQERENRTHRN